MKDPDAFPNPGSEPPLEGEDIQSRDPEPGISPEAEFVRQIIPREGNRAEGTTDEDALDKISQEEQDLAAEIERQRYGDPEDLDSA